ncbi:MAG: transcriptional regulator [Rhodospirillaceae bacterium]|nr:transcriptional regulator [Rhodospirillaceae bacterium]|tara:strand:- start:94 stop:447 length:354 start_codon:yes stop_codon:yes gene_type:complete
MTPFGFKVRELRTGKGITLKEMAAALEVSSAYLSALEHGRRGRPTRYQVQRICEYFNIIWDDAEELERLAALSHPRVTVDTAGLSAEATELANRLSQKIRKLPPEKIERLLVELREG